MNVSIITAADAADAATVHVGLSQSLVALVTLATVLVYGLAILRRPSPATTLWGVAFGVGLFATYVWVAADQTGNASVRALAAGLMLTFEPLVWSGLRLFAGRRVRWVETLGFVAVVPPALALSAEQESFSLVLSIAFALAGVFAASIAVELARMQAPSRDITLPLLLVSAAFVVIAALNLFWQLFAPHPVSAEQVSILRDVNGMGTLVTSYCAAVTIVLLVRSESQGVGEQACRDSTGSLRDRVARIREHDDPSWSLLDVRLDDRADLREASGQSDFAEILRRFHSRVRAALPPSADITGWDDSRLLVLLPGSEESAGHQLRQLLDRISAVDKQDDRAAIRVSVSVGWATVREARFDFDAMVTLAAERAEIARERGGDRWEPARPAAETMAIGIV
ncbi:GGDEF domain-containing protein [Microbacterium sp. NPDC089318]